MPAKPGRLAAMPAVAGAAIAVLVGLVQAAAPFPDELRTPRPAALLAPLAAAPIPPGSAVLIAIPVSLSGRDASPLLYEAAWQRPDLRWTLAPADSGITYVVALTGAHVPAGLSPLWQRGDIAVHRRARR